MEDDLLENARQQAEKADASIRAAALLRIARAESAGDLARARRTLLEGLDAVQKLAPTGRERLLEEARWVAAAVSPELLGEIPETHRFGPRQFDSSHIVQTMLAHGHVEAAFHYVAGHGDPGSFPFFSVGGVLQHLDPRSPESAHRRLSLLRHALEMWRECPPGPHFHGRDQFVQLFARHWTEFPADEASAVAHMVVERAVSEPDAAITAGYMNEVRFSSTRQNTLFQILHVLRRLDPALAQSLLDSHDQLAAAARRYPNGLETMNEEIEADVKRRQASGTTCESGGYILGGDPADFPRQRRLIDAMRSGEFAQAIEDALEKYREDTSPDTRNYAPKEYWPSTGVFRTVLYQAGQRLGVDAASLLERIPDDDLRLFASIELAAALAGVPGPRAIQMKQPNPANSGRIGSNRMISSATGGRGGADSPGMRSPDGRVIRCPKCLFRPAASLRWTCKCGHSWNTFWTSGRCPACHFQWEVTSCPGCGEMSEHRAWYAPEQG
jgi:hypothetical protein